MLREVDKTEGKKEGKKASPEHYSMEWNVEEVEEWQGFFLDTDVSDSP